MELADQFTQSMQEAHRRVRGALLDSMEAFRNQHRTSAHDGLSVRGKPLPKATIEALLQTCEHTLQVNFNLFG